MTVTAQPAPAGAGGVGLPSPPATGTVPQAAPSPPKTVHKPTLKPAGPTTAQVRSALAGVLAPTGASARIAKLVKRGAYTFAFKAPSSGKLVIDWYQVPANEHAKRVLVASATASIKKAGKLSVKLTLTKAGKQAPAARQAPAADRHGELHADAPVDHDADAHPRPAPLSFHTTLDALARRHLPDAAAGRFEASR